MLFAESAWNAATTQTMVPPIHNLSVKNFDEMEKRMQDSYEHFIQIFAGYIIDDTAKEGEDGQWNLVFEVREEFTMSSMSCWMPMPGIGMYAATKAYIRVLSRTMYLELKECGVSVTVACPGGIATDLFGLSKKLQRLAVRLGVLVTPEKFVKGALKAMFRRRKQYINGMLNRFSIFFVSIIPTRIRLIVKHKLLNKKFNG